MVGNSLPAQGVGNCRHERTSYYRSNHDAYRPPQSEGGSTIWLLPGIPLNTTRFHQWLILSFRCQLWHASPLCSTHGKLKTLVVTRRGNAHPAWFSLGCVPAMSLDPFFTPQMTLRSTARASSPTLSCSPQLVSSLRKFLVDYHPARFIKC
jgi:hypothetical protein